MRLLSFIFATGTFRQEHGVVSSFAYIYIIKQPI